MKGMVRGVGQEGSERAEKETFLVVQGLTLHAPNAGAPGLIPGQGTRSHMPQLKKNNIPHSATKTWPSQIN